MTQITFEAMHRWFVGFAALIDEHADELTQLDSAIGDADHGVNMQRGATAIRDALGSMSGATPADMFNDVGDALLEGIGGAAGPLYGSFLIGAAQPVGGLAALDLARLALSIDAGVRALSGRGSAEPGDKTMFDAAAPAAAALAEAAAEGESLTDAASRAHEAARLGLHATEPMQARKGRAAYLGVRSIGHLDPGAASMTLLFEALAGACEDTP